MLSEAPFRRPDSEDRSKISGEQCWDTTLQLQLDTASPPPSLPAPPQRVPSILTGQSSAIKTAHSTDQCIPMFAQPGKPAGLSSFEKLMKDLETKEAETTSKQHTPLIDPSDGGVKKGGVKKGRHRDWMNFVTLGENEHKYDIKEDKEDRKVDEKQKVELQSDVQKEKEEIFDRKQQNKEQKIEKEQQDFEEVEQKCEEELHLELSPPAVVSL